LLAEYKKNGNTSLKDAVQLVAKAHRLSRSAVYRLALEIWQ
jgi:predicted transcriptional regulator YheO